MTNPTTGLTGMAAAIALAMLTAGAARADVITLDITAYTDGRDLLYIQGDQIQWHHLDYAAPGRLGGVDLPTLVVITLNGAPVDSLSWTPTWPLPPPDEIRFPATSDILTWAPGAPLSGDLTASLQVVQARDSLTLFQSPSALNGYTTILDFNDDPAAGAASYEGILTLDTSGGGMGGGTPEPGTWAMMLVGFGMIGLGLRTTAVRRKRLN